MDAPRQLLGASDPRGNAGVGEWGSEGYTVDERGGLGWACKSPLWISGKGGRKAEYTMDRALSLCSLARSSYALPASRSRTMQLP